MCGHGYFRIRKEKLADSKISGYVWTGSNKVTFKISQEVLTTHLKLFQNFTGNLSEKTFVINTSRQNIPLQKYKNVYNNNVSTKKRFQVATTKEVFLDVIMEQ